MTKMAKDVEGGEVRRPYNIRERKEKDAAEAEDGTAKTRRVPSPARSCRPATGW